MKRPHLKPAVVLLTLIGLLAACSQSPAPPVAEPAPLQTQAVTGGQVVAWGLNDYGQTTVPALPTGIRYTAVAAGFHHSLALRSDGQVVAWGYSGYGQTTVPTLPEGMSYTAVAAGASHSLALRSDGQVVAWGYSGYGMPTLPEGMSYTAVAAGFYYSLALRSDGQVVTWGDYDTNWHSQTKVPALPTGIRYTAVAAGASHSLALRSDGQVVAWGLSGSGQTTVPTLPEGMSYTAVAAGASHSLALRSDGQVVAWGLSGSGQTTVPTLPEGMSYTAVAGTYHHSLALRSDGQVVAWGLSGSGQTTVPTLPEGMSYTAVAAGASHSLALTDTLPKQDQMISFTSAVPTDAHVGGSATVTATASSGLAVTLASTTLNVCTLSGDTVSFVATGTCTLSANQAGNDGFNPAPEVTQSFTVSPPADTTPPVITGNVDGTLGSNGWYTSDVTVTWTVTDPDSDVTERTGCDSATLSSDTTGQAITCTATSAGGTSSQSVTVKRDATHPTIAFDLRTPANGNGWNKGDVTVTWTCRDDTSGVVSVTVSQTVSAEGGDQSSTGTCEDTAGNSASDTQSGINIDKTAPTLNPVVSPNPILLNGLAVANANTTDIGSTIASQSCSDVDTSRVGSKSVSCTATDNAGNSATASAWYTVTYGFSGFSAPVDNLPTLNKAKAGQAIPLKWRLTDANGAPVTTLGSVQVSVASLSCSLGSTPDAIEEYASGSSGLQNLGDGYYQYNWKTPKSYASSCKTLQLDLGDGLYSTAAFQFTK